MNDYDFTLKYKLTGVALSQDELVESLGACACDDALIGLGVAGRIALAFTRAAQSAEAAMFSAIADVQRAIPTAELIEAAPDFVGLSDIADVVGVSRQYMRKLMLTHGNSFPAPVHEGSASVWHLAEVLCWLQARGAYAVAATVLEVAGTAMQINLANQAKHIQPRMRRAFAALSA